jgi:hypothetical protein
VETLQGQVQQIEKQNEKHTKTIKTKTLTAKTEDKTQQHVDNLKGEVQQLQGENKKIKAGTRGEKELLKTLHEQVQSLQEDNAMINNDWGARNITEATDGPPENTRPDNSDRSADSENGTDFRETATTDDSDKIPVTDNSKNSTNKKLATKEDKVFSHFFSHIPKSGSSYAYSVIYQLTVRSPEWNALPEGELFRACDMGGGGDPSKFNERYPYQFRGKKCTMWMSEKPSRAYMSPSPEHSYVIVRQPKAHVLSMYFHCKESKIHRNRAHFMPSLDDWLDAWVDAIGDQTKAKENKRLFRCYNPTNHQTEHVLFDPDKPDKDKGKEHLKSRYDVIGDTAQMDKSVCMIFIRWTGWVPKECDCSNASNALSIKSKLTADSALFVARASSRRRHLREQLLDLGYNLTKHSHGVKNHGATFKTTQYQNQAIAKLNDMDDLLYEATREVFQEQVHEVEEEYQIKVCDQFRV